MSKYYFQEECLTSEQPEIGFGNEFGELEIVGYLVAVARSGFAPVWAIKTGGTVNNSFGVMHKGIIYFGACDHLFYAVDAATGQKIWDFKTDDVILSKPCIAKDTIYFGSFDGNLYAIDLKGSLKWKYPVRSKISCTIKHAGGRLFLGAEDGKFYCISLDGKLIWHFATMDSIVENAAIGDNILVFTSWDKNVYALDFDGNIVWKFRAKAELNVEPVIDNGVVYLGSADKNMYALDLKTGGEIWRTSLDGAVRGVTLAKETLLVTVYADKIHALDTDGKVIWAFKTKGYSVSPPIVSDDVIYFTSTDKNIYALDMDGNMKWKFPAKALSVAQPIVWDGKVYFGSYDCNVYCLDLDGKLLWRFQTSRSDVSKIDLDEYQGRKQKKFILKPQVVNAEGESYKTEHCTAEGGNLGQYTVETGYTTNMAKYKKGVGKYGG